MQRKLIAKFLSWLEFSGFKVCVCSIRPLSIDFLTTPRQCTSFRFNWSSRPNLRILPSDTLQHVFHDRKGNMDARTLFFFGQYGLLTYPGETFVPTFNIHNNRSPSWWYKLSSLPCNSKAMLLEDMMEYYTERIEGDDPQLSISSILILSAIGLGLVPSSSYLQLINSFTISCSIILIRHRFSWHSHSSSSPTSSFSRSLFETHSWPIRMLFRGIPFSPFSAST